MQLLSGGRLIKTTGFGAQRDVGDPVKSSKVYSDQDADELLLLNIERAANGVTALAAAVTKIAEYCFVPLTVGGGINSVYDAAHLFSIGADKVLINSAAYGNADLVVELAEYFGRQAIVIGIDVRFERGDYVLYSDCGRFREIVSLESHVRAMTAAGAGELMIQSIDCDGAMRGYDLNLLRRTLACSPIPVIAAAGAGNFLHLKEAFEVGVDAAACGSLFNFGDNNPLRAKAFLKNHGIPLKRI